MIDLKRKAKKMKTTLGPEPMEYSEPEYYHGTKIEFEKPELDKLDISLDDYSIGDKIEAAVHMEVIELRSSDSMDGEPHETLGLQITHVDLD